jgi:hypothetical protein
MPFEKQTHALVFDLSEAEALVKVKGGVESFDVDGQHIRHCVIYFAPRVELACFANYNSPV